jgi:hypothetical protein
MQDFEKLGAFYLGRAGENLLLYDSKDLVTHAVCVGMTGSGKTGLCISLLEEAAIDGIPALVIDPKGDLTNLLLQFPDLRTEDFAPWVNEGESAEQQAQIWRDGLAKWGESGERIRKLQTSADFAIYTPGSNSGLPLSILKSFAPPKGTAADDAEIWRDRVAVTATAILSLIGIDADPVKSREHILVSALFNNAWQQGRELDLATLIQQIQNPPIQRVGVMELESFFAAKDRFDLAMSLNNMLASAGFESWMEGEPIDIDHLLRTPGGKPRISVISISHLSDTERMFFVSLLLNETLSWTRSQSGTPSLRAIVYMDEIFGYFPPVANPPSKKPLLTLLKQARAFGVGIVLATQNPVDLDYKGLANCGTWFVGRLQTERDKNRLMDGLESASADSGAHFDRQQISAIIAGLGKRMFLLNNIHESQPLIFESRWALSYLRGPLTRVQVKQLMDPRRTSVASKAAPAAVSAAPVLPPEIPQSFIPARGSGEIIYEPCILGAAQVRFGDKPMDVVFTAPIKDDGVPVQWEESTAVQVDPNDLEKSAAAGAQFTSLPPQASVAKNYAGWNKDFVTWLYCNQELKLFRSPSTDLTSNPAETERDFRARIQQAAHEERDRQVEALRHQYAPKLTIAQEKLRRAQLAVDQEKQQSQAQTVQSAIAVGAAALGFLFGRKTISKTSINSAATAARSVTRAYKQSQDVNLIEQNVTAAQQQLNDLNAQLQTEIDAIQARIDPATEAFEPISIKPKKTDISVRVFTLAWAPYRKDPQGQITPAH